MATITYPQFETFAKNFAALSEKVGDSWELRSAGDIPHVVYLVKTCAHVIDTATGGDCVLVDLGVEGNLVEENDDATVRHDVLQCRSPVWLEYHVVYSVSYSVPTLYLNAYHQNGKSLSIDDIWKLIPSFYGPSTDTKWEILSQQEHPILNRPFYYIHPCHTSTALSTVYSKSKDTSDLGNIPDRTNYILTWLSMFGPMVGLSLSLKYCDP